MADGAARRLWARECARAAYRSFDRQKIIADARLIARPRMPLWLAHSDKQIYLTSLFTQPLGHGPALVASAEIPDLDSFRGSFGAKATLPLYRDAAAKQPNILPGLLDLWGRKLKRKITPQAFAAYVYGLLAHPGYVQRFYNQLEDQEVRVPLTLNREKYCEVYAAGATLLCLHMYGQRSVPEGSRLVDVPHGEARYNVAISTDADKYPEEYEYLPASRTLRIGDGEFGPISPEVMAYEVSGLRVVDSWLGYRMKDRKGKKSSPLDDIHPESWPHEFSEELLQLLWIIEHTVAMHATLADLLAKICAGPLLSAADLPSVPDDMRKPPRAALGAGLFGPAEYTITDEDNDKEEPDGED